MSVRKRQWYSNKQIQAWATRSAQGEGQPEDRWPEYRARAKTELTALLRDARDKSNRERRRLAQEMIADFPPEEAWIVDYTDQDGDRHIQTFAKKKDAEAHHDKVRIDVRSGEHTAPSKSGTVSAAAERWIKHAEALGNERTTVRQYRQHVDLHIVPRIGKTKLGNLTPTKVEAFRDDLLENLSRPLARKVMTSLKSVLKLAKHAHVAADVSVKRDKRKDSKKLEIGRDIPTTAEVKRVIEAAEGTKRRTLLLLVSLTGLRASELRGLRWQDIDLKAGELHVRQRADRYRQIGAPKSESSVRTIPIPPDLITALKEWKLACPKGDADLVFPTAKGRVDNHKNMLASLASVMIKAGVVARDAEGKPVPKYALHAFRHFFASWCINPRSRGGRELPPKIVQQLLGHSSIVMTLDRYGHLFPRGDDRAELADAARALLG
jgi:integrase